MHGHGIAHGGVGEDILRRGAAGFQVLHGAGRAARGVLPHCLARRRERGVGQRQAKRLADDLGGGGRPQKLAATAGRAAGAAAELRRLRQRELAVRKAGTDGLNRPGVFAVRGRQSDTAGNQHGRKIVHRRKGDHHRRQTFVAGGHAEYASARWQRSDQPAQHLSRVVAVGQAVHHARRTLGTAVAGVAAEAGEGDRARRLQLMGRLFHQ